MKAIDEIVREYYDSSKFDQSSRKREVVTERQINHFLYTSLTCKSLEWIGETFRSPQKEQMSHATVLNSLKAVRAHYETEKSYRRKFEHLLEHLELEGYKINKIYKLLQEQHGSGRKHRRTRFVFKSRGTKKVYKGTERRYVNTRTKAEVCPIEGS